jgi:hypothetical protein
MRPCLLLSFALVLLMHCAHSPVSGPSTEEGNPQIVAMVLNGKNKPVSGVMVVARKTGSDSIPPDEPTQALATTTVTRYTSEDGRCSFNDLETGTYSLTAEDPSNNRSALKSPIEIIGDDYRDQIDTLQLGTSGSIEGIVSRGGVSGYSVSQNVLLMDAMIFVIIQEIGISTVTITDGSYSFDNIPPGTYTLIYYATDGFLSARQKIDITAGKTSIAPKITLIQVPRLLPPEDFTAVYDTEDSLVRLSWSPVEYDSLFRYEVDRIDEISETTITLRTTDTLVSDTVRGIPSGTVLFYVVRSVDKAFNKSVNAGPVEIIIE